MQTCKETAFASKTKLNYCKEGGVEHCFMLKNKAQRPQVTANRRNYLAEHTDPEHRVQLPPTRTNTSDSQTQATFHAAPALFVNAYFKIQGNNLTPWCQTLVQPIADRMGKNKENLCNKAKHKRVTSAIFTRSTIWSVSEVQRRSSFIFKSSKSLLPRYKGKLLFPFPCSSPITPSPDLPF